MPFFYLKCYDDAIFEVRNWLLDSGLVSLNLSLVGSGEMRGGEWGAGSHLVLAICLSSCSEELRGTIFS